MAHSSSRRGKSSLLGRLRTYATPIAASALAIGVASTVFSSPYKKDYDLTASIDALIAPGAATLVGHYAAFEEDGVHLTGGSQKVRDEVAARFEQIRAAGHSGGVFDHLEDYVEKGYQDVKAGHITVIDAAFFGATILHTDRRLKSYAEATQAGLGAYGFDAEGAQKITAGLIGTELLSEETKEKVTARKYIRKTDLEPGAEAFLTRGIKDLEVSVRAVKHATSVRDLAVNQRKADSQEEEPQHGVSAPGQYRASEVEDLQAPRILSVESTGTRPEARPAHLARMSRIQEHILETAQTRPEARTLRIQEKARQLAMIRRPAARPAQESSDPEL